MVSIKQKIPFCHKKLLLLASKSLLLLACNLCTNWKKDLTLKSSAVRLNISFELYFSSHSLIHMRSVTKIFFSVN